MQLRVENTHTHTQTIAGQISHRRHPCLASAGCTSTYCNSLGSKLEASTRLSFQTTSPEQPPLMEQTTDNRGEAIANSEHT